MKRIATRPAKYLLWLFALPWFFALAQAVFNLYSHLAGSSVSDTQNALLMDVWSGFLFVVVMIALGDYLNALIAPKLSFKRQCKDILSLHRWADVELNVNADELKRPATLTIAELADNHLELSEDPLSCQLKPLHNTKLTYKVRANRRGDAHIHGLHLKLLSKFRLWHSVWEESTQTTLKVYPDFQAISGYTLLAQDNHVSQFGIKRKPRRGEGMEFHQLREYQKGDTSRQIDWKATARKQKLISRDYQDERDQQIIVLLDNGRRMRTEDEQLGHLDHAINAMSLLSHIALKQGDAMGLMTFGVEKRWLPCQKGSSHINTILNHVYDLQPGNHATDYSSAAQSLVKLQRKRSLVILITNTRDEDFDDLMPAIKLIGKHHLVLLANIREPVLQKALEEPVNSEEQAYQYMGIMDYLERREEVKKQLLDAGVFTLDSHPANLPVDVCNGYLSIKRSGRL